MLISTGSQLLFDALSDVFIPLGFDALGDPVFRDLADARIVEPALVLDAGRVLADLDRKPTAKTMPYPDPVPGGILVPAGRRRLLPASPLTGKV